MNYRPLDEQIYSLREQLDELQDELFERQKAPWHIFIFRETGPKPHALAIAIGRTSAEAREVLQKKIDNEYIAVDQAKLQLCKVFTLMEHEIPPEDLAEIAVPDERAYLPF
jgi:hypothetical protein